MLVPLLQRLRHIPCATQFCRILLARSEQRPPSLHSVAAFVANVAKRYMHDWGQLNPRNARFQALIFGQCPVMQKLAAYTIVPTVGQVFDVRTELANLDRPIAFGSAVQEFKDELQLLSEHGDRHGRSTRLPLLAIENVISKQTRLDVGGDIQIAITDSEGTNFFQRARTGLGNFGIEMRFLGFEIREFRNDRWMLVRYARSSLKPIRQ